MTMNSNSAQSRVQKGVPTGGQFAETTHAESDLVLTDDTPETVEFSRGHYDNLTAATPPQVDEVLAEVDADFWSAYDDRERALDRVHIAVGDRRDYNSRWNYGEWKMGTEDALGLAEKAKDAGDSNATSALRLHAEAGERMVDAREEAAVLEAEFDRRGGWTRAYLVDNADGHVHKTRRCSTCNKGERPTRFHWVTEKSGADENEIVEEAGERACTTCYPSAPIDVLKRPSRIEGPNQREAREAAAARANEKAERKAKLNAEQVLDPETGKQLFKTERGATNFISGEMQSMHWYGSTHPSYSKWEKDVRATVAAVAAKRGVDADELYAELDAKAKKKVEKDRRG